MHEVKTSLLNVKSLLLFVKYLILRRTFPTLFRGSRKIAPVPKARGNLNQRLTYHRKNRKMSGMGMRLSIRRLMKWGIWALGGIVVLLGLYLSVFFFPYPLFPHHAEFAGFSVYSDRKIPAEFEPVFSDARHRVEKMELYRGEPPLRIFICRSHRRFALLVRLAGKRYAGQGLLISVAGNAFLSETGIEAVARRNRGRPAHSRLDGSWSAAIAHEVAHHLVFAELGFKKTRMIPAWKSEGYADYSANLASTAADPDYDFRDRISLLLDDSSWQHPTGSIDRRHFRWHLLVEYLCAVKDLGFSDLLDERVTEGGTRSEMMAWYEESPAR